MTEEEKNQGSSAWVNIKLKPFLGFILFVRQGEAIPIFWWNKLYYVGFPKKHDLE